MLGIINEINYRKNCTKINYSLCVVVVATYFRA